MHEIHEILLSSEIQFHLEKYINENQFDIILSDTPLEDYNYINIQGHDIRGVLHTHSQENEKILLIIENNTIDTLFPLLTTVENITIIDIHTGIFALGEKSYLPRISVYSLLPYGFEIHSPVDSNNLKNIFDNNYTKKYIEINTIPVPKVVSKGEEYPITVQYDTQGKHDTTIFTVGYPFIAVGQALQQLEIENLLLMISDTLVLNDKALSHIKESKNIIVVIDTQYPEIIKAMLQAQLYENGIFDKQLSIITPKYEKLGTILKEYQLQETEFDTEGILKQLQEIR